MTMTPTEAAAHARRVHYSRATPEQRQRQTRPARIASAVKAVVDLAPELTDEQRNKLRVILTQAPQIAAHEAGEG